MEGGDDLQEVWYFSEEPDPEVPWWAAPLLCVLTFCVVAFVLYQVSR